MKATNQFYDKDLTRRNLTTSQQKNNANTKEGVVVNSFIKDCPECKVSLHDVYDSLVISSNTPMPKQLNEPKTKEKNLIPISGITVGVMGALTATTAFIQHSAKINLNMDKMKKLPSTIRNVAINDEAQQAIYQVVQCPNKQTIVAGAGVIVLTAAAFMSKTFIDGFKEVWVKKKEANIEKNLQEKLIDIETQSFSGKIQITRSMMSEKAKEFSKILENNNDETQNKPQSFMSKFMPAFGKNSQNTNNKNDKNSLNYFLLGTATLATIVGLGYMAMRNLSKSRGHLDKLIGEIRGEIDTIVTKTTETPTKEELSNLKNLFISVQSHPTEMAEKLGKTKWSKEDITKFIKETSTEINKSTVDANIYCGGGKTPKPTFYSHVDDYRAFFYNYLLDTDNKQFKALFFGITGMSALSYGGKVLGDGVKEVQVKKINAETELDLQQRLVSTELKNFKSKKSAAIEPLVDEFYKQVENDKPKEELKVMADNILFEIKNGPPFVYS
ncbi:MAG: hypothetical protein R3Y28_03380 [Candidatus Gastranaerophilales bacterium]